MPLPGLWPPPNRSTPPPGRGPPAASPPGPFAPTHILTSQDFSWLQNGQVNCVSSVPVTFFLGGGFRLDLRRPMAAGTATDPVTGRGPGGRSSSRHPASRSHRGRGPDLQWATTGASSTARPPYPPAVPPGLPQPGPRSTPPAVFPGPSPRPTCRPVPLRSRRDSPCDGHFRRGATEAAPAPPPPGATSARPAPIGRPTRVPSQPAVAPPPPAIGGETRLFWGGRGNSSVQSPLLGAHWGPVEAGARGFYSASGVPEVRGHRGPALCPQVKGHEGSGPIPVPPRGPRAPRGPGAAGCPCRVPHGLGTQGSLMGVPPMPGAGGATRCPLASPAVSGPGALQGPGVLQGPGTAGVRCWGSWGSQVTGG